jgi:REP element-mobilizing transposase RayT
LQKETGAVTRPRRLDSYEYVGHRQYFLTICTYRRRAWFLDGAVVTDVTSHFLRTASAERVSLLAYCFMPDHFHALASADSESSDLQRFVRLSKQRSGFAFKRTYAERLWQASYFDRTLRENETVPATIAYIVANPVRAGIVSSPGEYPYWGSQIYTRDEVLDFISTECRV